MTDFPRVPLVSTLRDLLHPPAARGRCELCAADLPDSHPHVVDIHTRRLLCACGLCGTRGRTSAGVHGGAAPTTSRFSAVPSRYVHRASMTLSAADWHTLSIPVDVAFFFYNSTLGRTVALYPGPAGATESLLPLEAWSTLADANPWLRTIAPDVEALLVRKVDSRYACVLVPIDACYELVGRIRTHWSGLGGGEAVRTEIEKFFRTVLEQAAGSAEPTVTCVAAPRGAQA